MTSSRSSIAYRALAALLCAGMLVSTASALPLAIADVPVFLNATNAEPLVMIALANDEQLYHKAYTDFDDVNGDGVIDTTYTDTISYYGYFDPLKCYSYSGTVTAGTFNPTALAGGNNGHSCDSASGGGRWSGNFLNWATMARVDALRKVLFGGYRSTDTATSTILERTYLPNDNHSWAKFYNNVNADLNQFTPYDNSKYPYPTGITMCNVTPQGGSTDNSEANTTSPRFRVAKGQWTEWAAEESKQCLWRSEFNPTDAGANPVDTGTTPDKIDEFTVRVQACVSGLVGSEKCKTYGTSSKPIGLLQDFADYDQLKIRFGLMTGSYGARKSGGLLRKNIARFTDEVSSTDGTFTGVAGIVKSINLMRISRYSYGQPGYSGLSPDNCPFNQNTWKNGSCSDWGNPMGEIYLEALRYFVGTASPSAAYASTDTTWIPGLTSVSWVNPYGPVSPDAKGNGPVGGGASSCAKPNILPISTSVFSFDNDDYSGASSIPGLTINTQTDAVGANEGINGNKFFVGSLGDGTGGGGSPGDTCTSQTVASLSHVTGICPQAGGLQGSYAIAGLAYYAHQKSTSLQTVGTRKIAPVDTYAVALSPPLPAIKIPVGGQTVTLQPAAYNTRNSNAMQLVNFRVVTQAADNSSGTYFMNFENAPAGSDYDNDEKGYLQYQVTGSTIKVLVYQSGSSAGATQKMGYIIDGVTDAGTYYLVSNNDLAADKQQGGGTWTTVSQATVDSNCATAKFAANPLAASVTNEECYYATPGSSAPGTIAYNRGVKTHTAGGSTTGQLQSPLWYAAKYGGFKDINGDGLPSSNNEWAANDPKAQTPDNYFYVTNPALLETQLSNAFTAIIAHAGSASSASVNSGSISSNTRVFQAKFDTSAWSGQLLAYTIATDGTIGATPTWDASQKIPAPDSRNIVATNSDGTAVSFLWNSLDATRQGQLQPSDTLGQDRLKFLRGDQTKEISAGGSFRNRDSPLGDIVNSAPVYMGKPPFRYSDSLEKTPYSSFRSNNSARAPMVYVGANDGMLHAFDANTDTAAASVLAAGTEKFAFIPSAVFPNLYNLPNKSYSHLYFVDGTPSVVDAYVGGAWTTVLAAGLNKGGREIYALDVTDPTTFGPKKVMWEFTSAQDADLGYTYSRPAIVKTHTGGWVAIFGNGYNGTGNGTAVLFIVDIATGKLVAKIDTKAGSKATPNGLATPAVIDLDNDGMADYVYAGDLLGNMWKFDITSTTASSWNIPYTKIDSTGKSVPAALFTATDASGNAQPITERPQVGFGPGGAGLVVLFGTGKFIESSDRTVDTTNPRVQSFYGIFDNNTGASSDLVPLRTSSPSPLRQQTIVAQQQVTVPVLQSDGKTTVNVTYNIRVVSKNVVNIPGDRGWYLDLEYNNVYEAEKQVSDPILRNGKIIFTTTIPDPDPCKYGGRSWLMEMDSLTGGELQYTPFDLNGDKNFNDSDFVTVTLPDGTTETVPAAGLQSDDGLLTKPGIVSGPNAEYAITPDTSGVLEEHRQNPGPGALGRQSWRQLR